MPWNALRFNARPRDAFAGARRGQSFEILGIAGRLFDLPEALDMARQALRRSRSQTVHGAIIFLEDYFKAREGTEVPDDIRTALLTVVETTDSRSTATGALNVLVETGEISDMEALDRGVHDVCRFDVPPSHSCPVIRNNVSRFLDTGSPEGKHFFVRPFVIAGKIPVADIFADALGRHGMQLGHIDGRFALPGETTPASRVQGKFSIQEACDATGSISFTLAPVFPRQNEQEYFRV